VASAILRLRHLFPRLDSGNLLENAGRDRLIEIAKSFREGRALELCHRAEGKHRCANGSSRREGQLHVFVRVLQGKVRRKVPESTFGAVRPISGERSVSTSVTTPRSRPDFAARTKASFMEVMMLAATRLAQSFRTEP